VPGLPSYADAMPELVDPHPRYQSSFLASVVEILAAGEEERSTGLATIPAIAGSPGESFTLGELRDPHRFSTYISRLRSLADPTTALPPGIVPATQLWWVDGDEYLGRLAIRHSLTPWLLEFGGHIGYAVRPSARRRGHATAMLAAALPVARRLGIDPALLTCDDTNGASRRVIEANGGVLDDQRGEKLRYWMPTS